LFLQEQIKDIIIIFLASLVFVVELYGTPVAVSAPF
jgi:hypothetical protein